MTYLLQQLLLKSASKSPYQEAIIDRNRSITYQELDQYSHQLACTLKEAGIVRGDRVGIYLKKSIEAIIAIFGILKAGAVYVPLDPSAPAKRISFIIDNCSLKALITTQNQSAKLDFEQSSIKFLVLTEQQQSEDNRNLASVKKIYWQDVLHQEIQQINYNDLIEDDLAYILYTSGSTGMPKGVMISHRTSLTFVNWSYNCFQVRSTDRVSSHAPFHFDLSIFDIFTTIKAGGTIILVPPELSVFPINLAEFIEKQQISIWYSVPSILTQLVLRGNLHQYQFSNLRTILFAGEVFPIKYLRKLMDVIPLAEYYNLYGPTETNVCTYYKVTPIPEEQTDPLTIGKACENTEVFVVNDDNQIVQPGEIGELYVRSPSIMTGYWKLPEKTQQLRVVYNLHPNLGAEIVYRTGDLVKQRTDGNYIYLGRRDNQVKSRGYRIELGEIETVIYSHPAIEELAVIAIPDEEIGNYLKVIIALREGNSLTKNQLEAFCATKLPKYMIPTIIEFRDTLPKTSTGKIDRTLLRQQHLQENFTQEI
jgi:amino acid adenylation domain-containing protein